MNIIFFGGMPPPITGVRFANKVIYHYLAVNHAIFLIDIKVQPEEKNKIKLYKLIDMLLYIKKALRFFRKNSIDVLYCTMNQSLLGFLKFVPVLLLSKLYKAPYVLHFHGNLLPETYINANIFFKYIINKTLKGSMNIILLSEILASQKIYNQFQDKVRIVYNFVENDVFTNYKQTQKGEGIKLIYMSNFIKSKGILDLLEACLILKKKGVKFELKLAGGWYDADTKAKVIEYIQRLGHRVEFLGVVQGRDKFNLLNWGDVFTLPTYYAQEGQPISILEAMATGNLILTTKHSGIPDIVKGNINGFFVDAKDPVGIAEQIMFIADNKKVLDEIKTNNCEEAKQYSVERFSSSIESILKGAAHSYRH